MSVRWGAAQYVDPINHPFTQCWLSYVDYGLSAMTVCTFEPKWYAGYSAWLVWQTYPIEQWMAIDKVEMWKWECN